jgi:hypothetical protein
MKGRIRIATVGVMAAMLATSIASSAGASASTWNVKADGGFLSVSLLKTIGLAGGSSEADATSSPSAEAIGTGLCLTVAQSTNPCPTTPSSVLTGQAISTTQTAVQNGANGTASPKPAGASGACLIPPLNLAIVNLSAACGIASASEDASGNPTASSTGSLANASVSLSLGNIMGLLGLSNTGLLPSTGALCPSGSAPAATSTGTAGTAPAAGSPLSGLLGTVNSLLSGAGLPSLLGTSVASSSSSPLGLLAPVCSILNGLVSELTGAAGLSNLVNLNANTPLLTVDVGRSDSNVTTSADGSTETATATQHAVDVNVLGMLDIQVTPNSASVSVNKNTGVATPSVSTGLLSVTTGGGVPSIITAPDLTSLLNNLLNSLNLGGALSGLIDPTLTKVFAAETTTSPDGTSATATSADLDLSLLGGNLTINLGDAKASGSSTTAVPAVKTLAATTPAAPAAAPAAPAAAVPNVTTVHTGEFWSGGLAVILLSVMGLGGLALVSRRRLFSAAHAIAARRGSKFRP